jgi:hypothetical protein
MSGVEKLACHHSDTGVEVIEDVSFLGYDDNLASRKLVRGHASPAGRCNGIPLT